MIDIIHFQLTELKPKKRRRRRTRKDKLSKGAGYIKDWLIDNDVEFETEKTFSDLVYIGPLRFDFFLPEFNCLIEFDGEQHTTHIEKFHTKKQFLEQQKRDNLKDEYCDKAENPNLLRIRYDEIGQIDEILSSYLRL